MREIKGFVGNSGLERRNNKNYILRYTFIFIVAAISVYWRFFIEKKTFIWMQDGWDQHYKALLYYSDWLQDIIQNLMSTHKLVIPKWSLNIGYGSDIITTLHYYVIGDPLNLLSVLIPNRYMSYFYDALVLVRIYLSGLAFSYYCFYRKYHNFYAIVSGSLIYSFCGFVLAAAVHHPYFTNPMIYLPLLLVGVEKVLHKDKPYLFIGMVCLAAVSNFYFFYMLVLFVVLYVVFRVCVMYHRTQVREAVFFLLRLTGHSIIGLLLSAFLFFPVVVLFFSDSRSGSHYTFDWLYPIEYYQNFLMMFITKTRVNVEWTYWHYSSIALVLLFLLFIQRKKYIALKVAWIILTSMMLLPVFGYLWNGCSYVANRWTWGYGMIVGYIVVVMWEELFQAGKKTLLWLAALLAGYVVLATWHHKEDLTLFVIEIAIVILVLVMIPIGQRYLTGKKWISQAIVLVFVMFTIAVNAADYFVLDSDGLALYADRESVNDDLVSTQDAAVKEAAKDERSKDGDAVTEFYRYSGDFYAMTHNSTLQSGLSSTDYYWSLENGVISEFMYAMCLVNNYSFEYRDLDNRTILDELAGVKYYVVKGKSGKTVPYGYIKKGSYQISPMQYQVSELRERLKALNTDGWYTVYENQYALPLGYTYDSYITEDFYENLSAINKQESLVNSVVLNKKLSEDNTEQDTVQNITQMEFSSCEVDYQVICNENVEQEGNSFIVHSPIENEDSSQKATVILTFKGIENSETYLNLENLNFTGENKETTSTYLYIGSASGEIQKSLNFFAPNNRWYNNRHDFLVNISYSEDARTSIAITFSESGIYSFDKLSVICQSMESYAEQVNALKQDVLEHVEIETNEIRGDISLDTNKILCLSIPYSSGWTAYVDGKETELLQANTMYMALPLSAGMHDIHLVYQMPGEDIAMIFSLIGVCLLVGVIIWRKKSKKKA